MTVPIDFSFHVNAVVGPFLQTHAFVRRAVAAVDETDRVSVFYASAAFELCFYRSNRDGEVNCLVARKLAQPAQRGDWYFLNALINRGKTLSIDELLARVPSKPKGEEEQLRDICSSLSSNFDFLTAVLTDRP